MSRGFIKLWLLWRLESDGMMPDSKELCEIYTHEDDAYLERNIRERRQVDNWVEYKVEMWEIQE